ncbi:MAG: efflux RND transporter periplasmic adaptor subunit [Acetobacteraceae bacterium]
MPHAPLRSLLLLPLIAGLLTGVAHADTPRPVRVQTVQFVPQLVRATYAGTVQPRVQANLGFRVSGKVIARKVNIGDHVTAGQVLGVLDPTDLRFAAAAAAQAVKAAEAEAVRARADFDRYQQLGKASPAWLPSDYDRRKAALDGAEARLAQLRQQLALAVDQLSYTTLTADADSVVTDLRMEVGQVVAAGQTVASLAHMAETEIVVDVPENRLPDIRAAETIQLAVWSLPGQSFQGRTREIGALADAASRTFAVKVTLLDPPPQGTLGLGMTATVTFAHVAGPPIALLPAAAIVQAPTGSGGGPSVWVLDRAAHRATPHPVQVAAWRGDGQVAIAGGIPQGAEVVTAGAALLNETTPVTAWAGTLR